MFLDAAVQEKMVVDETCFLVLLFIWALEMLRRQQEALLQGSKIVTYLKNRKKW